MHHAHNKISACFCVKCLCNLGKSPAKHILIFLSKFPHILFAVEWPCKVSPHDPIVHQMTAGSQVTNEIVILWLTITISFPYARKLTRVIHINLNLMPPWIPEKDSQGRQTSRQSNKGYIVFLWFSRIVSSSGWQTASLSAQLQRKVSKSIGVLYKQPYKTVNSWLKQTCCVEFKSTSPLGKTKQNGACLKPVMWPKSLQKTSCSDWWQEVSHQLSNFFQQSILWLIANLKKYPKVDTKRTRYLPDL